MATTREPITWKLRNQLMTRENYTCQKCGRRNSELHGHHIIPVRDGGPDELDNLALLCGSCHFEWEGLQKVSVLPFEQWLSLPTAHYLLTVLLTEEAWHDDISASQMREHILYGASLWKDIKSREQRLTDADYEPEDGEVITKTRNGTLRSSKH